MHMKFYEVLMLETCNLLSLLHLEAGNANTNNCDDPFGAIARPLALISRVVCSILTIFIVHTTGLGV